MKNYSKLLFALLLAIAFGSYEASAQVTITQWNFDQEVVTPTLGSGTAENIGGTSTGWAGGNPSDGRGWNTSAYPEQSTLSGTAGVQFSVSTSGYSDIQVSWDNRNSNTAANRLRVQFTLNGADWTNFEASETNAVNQRLNGTPAGFDEGRFVADTGTIWYNRSIQLTAIAGANNNPAFAVRMVTEFVDGESYGASSPASSYGPSGTIRFDNVTFTGGTGTAPLLVADPAALSGFAYLVGEGPSEGQFTEISGSNLEPAAGEITVTAPASYEVSMDGSNYSNSLVFQYSDGMLSPEPVAVRLKAGLIAGNYTEVLSVSGGGAGALSISLSGTIASGLEPGLSEVILPLYMQGTVPNNLRVPYAYHATLINLLPNTTYRFYNKIVLGTDSPTYNGAGNVIFVSQTGDFTRTSSPSLATAGSYGEITTDANGSYSGWFMTEPTGNASRFEPGTELFMRIILNDGNNGTVETIYLTTTESAKVLGFGTAVSDTAGTAIRGLSDFTAKNFVLLYDNTAGTGRPLYGTHVEASGIDFAATNSYAPFYATNVSGIAGTWGGIVPNINANGVMRVEERAIATGAIVDQYTSANGIWGVTNTINPAGGLDNVLVINTIVGVPEIPVSIGKIYAYDNLLNIELTKSTSAVISVINLQGRNVVTYEMNGNKDSRAMDVPTGIYLVKIQTATGTFSQKVLIK